MTELKYLTRKEVCETLHISLPTLWEWSKTGKITSYRIGKRVLYKESDIESALTKVEPVSY